MTLVYLLGIRLCDLQILLAEFRVHAHKTCEREMFRQWIGEVVPGAMLVLRYQYAHKLPEL